MWIAVIVCAGVLVAAMLYFHTKENTLSIAKPAKAVYAVLLLAISILIVFFPSLFRQNQLDILSGDVISLNKAGTRVGDVIADAEPGADVYVVRYERAQSPVGEAIFQQQDAFIQGLFESEGLGQVKEYSAKVSSQAASGRLNAEGIPADWFPRASLDSAMQGAAPNTVVVLLTGLPRGMEASELDHENHRYVLFGADEGDLKSALRKQHALCAIREGRISEMDQPDGRYSVLTP